MLPGPGVVYENVNLAEVRENPVERAAHRLAVGDVLRIGADVEPAFLQGRDALFHRLGREVCRCDLYARLAEHPASGEADVSRCTRHNRHAVFELQCHFVHDAFPIEITENADSRIMMPTARKAFVFALVPFHSPENMPKSVEKNTVEDMMTAKEI